MLQKIQKTIDNLWWMFVLQGLLTVIFGLVALLLPGVTMTTLVYLFALYLLILSTVVLMRALLGISKDRAWWFLALVGIVGIFVGLYLMGNPGVAVETFLSIVGLILLLRGFFDLFLSAYMMKSAEARLLWAMSGAVGIIAAVIIWRYPVQTGAVFIWILGIYALVAGITNLIYAYRARLFIDEIKNKLRRTRN